MRHVAGIVLAFTVAGRLAAQTPSPAPLDWWSEDSACVAFVRAHGHASQYPHAIIWAPTDSLDPRWLPHFEVSTAASLNALQALMGAPYPWQRIGDRPVVFFFSPSRFISHATGQDTVFIPLDRIRQGWGPFLHEAAHELLAPPPPFSPFEYPDSLVGEQKAAVSPLWLNEGSPDYLAQAVAQATGFREGDVFEVGGLTKVDSTCRARLSGHPRRTAIAAKLGGQGPLEALYTADRQQVASTYYACRQSFTKFLAAAVGVRALVSLFPLIASERWQADLETRAGVPLPALRRTWLAVLNVPDDGGE
jgi:hypothetical protein